MIASLSFVQHRRRSVVALALLVLFASGCGGRVAAEDRDASVAPPDTSVSGFDASLPPYDSHFDPPAAPDTATPDAPSDIAPPPTIACDETGVAACKPPPPYCVDTYWLVYYAGGECVDGACRFEVKTKYCGPSYECREGKCYVTSTAK